MRVRGNVWRSFAYSTAVDTRDRWLTPNLDHRPWLHLRDQPPAAVLELGSRSIPLSQELAVLGATWPRTWRNGDGDWHFSLNPADSCEVPTEAQ